MPSNELRPYVGPRSFRRDDASVFFGRDREVGELEACVVAHGDVLLYAQSGAGKTSLINAKLIPNLEKAQFDVWPGVRVKGPVMPADRSKIQNIFVSNALTSLAPDEHIDNLPAMRFADFFEARKAVPNEDGFSRPRLLIFDQFEELFTFHTDRWQERRGFFEQLRDALAIDPSLRVLFSMREDHVAEIEPYASILPEQLRTRFRLERLRRESALEAITKPLSIAGYSFEEGVPSRLVTELLQVRYRAPDGKVLTTDGEFVETVQLQVVCEALWDSLAPNQRSIKHRDLTVLGDVDAVLQKFYEAALKKAVATGKITEGALRTWCERTLITEAGTRGTVYRGDDTSGGIPNVAVDVLENQHFIRGELRGGATWYELTHDRLIEPVRNSGRSWLIKGKLQVLEERAALWEEEGKETLLNQAEWEEAQKILEGSEAKTLGKSDNLMKFLDASRATLDLEDRTQREAWSMYQHFDQSAVAQQRSSRRTNFWLVILPLLVIVLTSLLFFIRGDQSYFLRLFEPAIHFVVLLCPIGIAALLTGINRFRYGTQWALFRGAAETIKSDIFKYRARAGAYGYGNASATLLLAASTRQILESLSQTEINRGQISERTGVVGPELLTTLSGAEYLRARVEDQIGYFQAKTSRSYRRLRVTQWGLYSICGGATLAAAVDMDFIAAIACGLLLAWLATNANDQTEQSQILYNQALAGLLSIKGWWEALTSSEKAQRSNIDTLVQRTEDTIKMEMAGWVQDLRPTTGGSTEAARQLGPIEVNVTDLSASFHEGPSSEKQAR